MADIRPMQSHENRDPATGRFLLRSEPHINATNLMAQAAQDNLPIPQPGARWIRYDTPTGPMMLDTHAFDKIKGA